LPAKSSEYCQIRNPKCYAPCSVLYASLTTDH
jgi:hypothetical protein